mmetsp:Transcript_105724/g.329525  ORF Transcript_105724/g.329525 Transcript_105724/m.329525 type:complete len:263 (-) Transcript_105724:165-953(-)
MRTVGLLTGVSYVSGLDYYRGINEKAAELVPKAKVMIPNPPMVIVSLDCDEYVDYLERNDDAGLQEYLLKGIKKIHAAGADFLVIASNTAHVCYGSIREALPGFPVLHIADTTAMSIRTFGFTRVGLLGTEPTMRDGSWLKSRLEAHGISVVVPSSESEARRCYDIICKELSFNELKDESRAFFVGLCRSMLTQGAQGVVLGCTEIELLVTARDVPDVPLFCSAELHIAAAARVAVGQACVENYAPTLDAGHQGLQPRPAHR